MLPGQRHWKDIKYQVEFLNVVGVLMFKVTFDLLFLPMPLSAKALSVMLNSTTATSRIFDNFIIGDNLCYKYIKKYRVFVYHSYILFTFL